MNKITLTIFSLSMFCLNHSGQAAVILLYSGEADSNPLSTVTDTWSEFNKDDGIPSGDVSVTTTPADVKFGTKAYDFGNTAGFNVIDLPGATNFGSTWTMSAFIKPDATKHSRLFSNYDGGGGLASSEFIFDFDPDASIGFNLRLLGGGGLNETVSGINFNDGLYHHVAATFNSGDVAMYLDGEQVYANSTGLTTLTLGAALRIGEDVAGSANENFLGQMDDILILDYVLNAEDMRYLNRNGAEAFLSVPEPNSLALLFLGAGMLHLFSRKRKMTIAS